MTISASLEDYLEAVLRLNEERKDASVGLVAARLSVRKPSVVRALDELKKRELVVQEPYGPAVLTRRGQAMARAIYARHALLRTFLTQLGVPAKTAETDACKMEHILSPVTLRCIQAHVKTSKK